MFALHDQGLRKWPDPTAGYLPFAVMAALPVAAVVMMALPSFMMMVVPPVPRMVLEFMLMNMVNDRPWHPNDGSGMVTAVGPVMLPAHFVHDAETIMGVAAADHKGKSRFDRDDSPIDIVSMSHRDG